MIKVGKEKFERAVNYSTYIKTVRELFEKGLITGNTQTPGYLAYTKVNLQRYSRLDKTVIVTDALKTAIDNMTKPIFLLVLTEGWCGDAAQNIGIFEAMARYSNKIKTGYLFRDENPDLMDQFLTNGTRSIPKALCINPETNEVLFSWGPRPALLQKQVQEMISAGVSKEDRGTAIHSWYHKDQTKEAQKELATLILATQIE